MSKGLYIRVEEGLLKRLDAFAKKMGYNRSETIREAVRRFLALETSASETRRMKAIVKSKMTLRELEEAYQGMR